MLFIVCVRRVLFLHEGKVVWHGPTADFETTSNPIVRQVLSFLRRLSELDPSSSICVMWVESLGPGRAVVGMILTKQNALCFFSSIPKQSD